PRGEQAGQIAQYRGLAASGRAPHKGVAGQSWGIQGGGTQPGGAPRHLTGDADDHRPDVPDGPHLAAAHRVAARNADPVPSRQGEKALPNLFRGGVRRAACAQIQYGRQFLVSRKEGLLRPAGEVPALIHPHPPAAHAKAQRPAPPKANLFNRGAHPSGQAFERAPNAGRRHAQHSGWQAQGTRPPPCPLHLIVCTTSLSYDKELRWVGRSGASDAFGSFSKEAPASFTGSPEAGSPPDASPSSSREKISSQLGQTNSSASPSKAEASNTASSPHAGQRISTKPPERISSSSAWSKTACSTSAKSSSSASRYPSISLWARCNSANWPAISSNTSSSASQVAFDAANPSPSRPASMPLRYAIRS